jgi:hypothetical protein
MDSVTGIDDNTSQQKSTTNGIVSDDDDYISTIDKYSIRDDRNHQPTIVICLVDKHHPQFVSIHKKVRSLLLMLKS